MMIKTFYKKLLTISLMLLVSGILTAQVSIQALQEQFDRLSVNELLDAGITNMSGTPLQVKAEFKVSDQKGQLIFTATSGAFELLNGMNMIRSLPLEYINYTDLRYQNILSQSGGMMPPGTYHIHISLKTSSGVLQRESIEKYVHLISPPLLVYPPHRSEVDEPRPVFSWLPPHPVYPVSSLNFEIKIVELQANQTLKEAISVNPPHFQKQKIYDTRLFYPANAMQLKQKTKYAWKVTAFLDDIYVGETEVWEFMLSDVDYSLEKPEEVIQSYAIIKNRPGQNIVIAVNKLKFSFEEDYHKGLLKCRITDHEQNTIFEPTQNMLRENGNNQYEIDLYENKYFKSGQIYELLVENDKGENFRLKFKFIRKTEPRP